MRNKASARGRIIDDRSEASSTVAVAVAESETIVASKAAERWCCRFCCCRGSRLDRDRRLPAAFTDLPP